MCKRATKALDNVYCLTRLKAAKRNDKLKSREGAAELLSVHEATLAKYELGTMNVSNDMALLMSEVYAAPELLHWYCCNECAIGKGIKHSISLKDVALIALEMNDTTAQLEKYNRLFIKIAKDNCINESEEETAVEIMTYFDEIQKVIEEYKLFVKNHFIKKEKARQA